ncbi:M4 family metallopeptidase [Myxococcus qinghaiensis]|uniref:M4 family metallopeptidase n=1 Tax=Myxococcus qinghaiensis TaxID=2906758 RepID=UPI0020A73215|nr:M4 family metallopeptidase [Myxococcus qinghaiensis]MCP3163984.1 M4 family metallopeptidase [Myxococcus qinghaiensis]
MLLKRGRGVVGATLLCLTMGACTEATPPKDSKEAVNEKTSEALTGAHQVLAVDKDSVPTFVKGPFGAAPTSEAALRGLQPATLAPVLAQVAPLFKVKPEQLFLKRAYVGADGDAHFRYGVRVNGVEIMGAELRLHARDGQVFAANGDARTDLPSSSAVATVSSELAVEQALKDKSSPADATLVGKPELVYWRDGGQLLLAYSLRMKGESLKGEPVDDTVLVNARSGDVFERLTHIHGALDRRVYDGRQGPGLPGTGSRMEGDPPVLDPIVNAAYDNTGAVWRCYKELFNRDSYNNAGAPLITTVHHRVNYVNAFWNGTQMVFGDGDGNTATNLANAIDITAHELTHAVTEYESNLIYSGESGGLNEAISDIFGAVCEWHSEGKVIDAGTFMIGEDVWTPEIPGDALRYLFNPKLDGASLDDYADYTSGVDVHYSSGIANLAFYLLSQGGTHPRFPARPAVTGVGIEKAARIVYKANTDLLLPSSNFEAAKVATEQAAIQLGYDAATVASVTAAWKAVQVGVVIEPPDAIPLTRNVPVSVSGARGAKAYAIGQVPEGATNLRFALSGGTGDADLYVRFGNTPTTSLYDCRPYTSGNNETCTFAAPTNGTWYVMLNGFTAYTNASLVMTYDGGYLQLEPNVAVGGLSGATNGTNGFFIQIPEAPEGGYRNITVKVEGGTGNADLYVRRGAFPTHSEYDCRGMKETNAERCDLKYVEGGKYYVWLYGAKGGYQNASLTVTYR